MAEKVEKRLTGREIFFYNWGQVGLAVVEGVLFTWIVYYLSPPPDSGRTIFIPIAAAGLIVSFGRLFDAVTDPFIGHVSDNLQSRWGRKRPFIMFGTPLMILTFILLWIPPVAGESIINVVYILVVFFLFFLFYSAVAIPYEAVVAEIAITSEDRVKLTSWKLVFIIIGFLGVAIAAPAMFENIGGLNMAIVTGAVGLFFMYLCLPGITELPAEFSRADKKMKMSDAFRATFSNSQFLYFGLAMIALYMCYMVILPVLPYFVTVILGKEPGFVMYIQVTYVLCMAAAIPLLGWLSQKYPKRTLFRAVTLLLAVLFPATFFVGYIPGVPLVAQGFILLCLTSIPLGGFVILAFSMVGDIVDYDQMLTGKRREAMYYAVFGFSRKVGFALATIVLPLLFENFGYTKENDLGIRLTFVMLGVVSLIGFVILNGYKLGDSPAETRELMAMEGLRKNEH